LIEEAVDSRGECGIVRMGEFDGDLRVGSVGEGSGWCGVGIGDQEFGRRESAERLGEREGLVEEQARGDQVRAWVVDGAVEEIAVGRVEDDGGDVGVLRGELNGE
jgi:hypothetical protein